MRTLPPARLVLLSLAAPALFVALVTTALPQSPSLKSTYDALRPQQRKLFEASPGIKPLAPAPGAVPTPAPRTAAPNDPAASHAARYAALSPSQQSTFYAITHALLNTTLHSKENGKPIGSPFEYVLQIEEILGQQPGQRGDKQFRLYARMNPAIADQLAASREFFRDKDNSIFHKGYPQNFRLGGRVPSIQFSLAPDSTRADIDVDYRSSRVPVGLFNGHLSAANSDVRPGRNYRGHVRRWQGLIAWWRSLFSFTEPPEAPPAPAAAVAGEARADLPDSAAIAKVEEAAAEFLNDWLVRRNTSSAMAFYSLTATARTNADEDAEDETVRGEDARKLFASILAEANRALGRRPNLASAITAAPVWDETYRPIDHADKALFTLYSITDAEAAEYLSHKTAESPSSPYGNYFLTVFQFRLADDSGGVLSLLWKKEGARWRIVSYDVEEP